ncbi:MAG: ABC transporter ATP-binding protein [Pseudomonadota bacterium]
MKKGRFKTCPYNIMIEIKNLYKSFNSTPVLKGVNLNIPVGKITVIIGPSGCGKTVLLRHIIALAKPDKGSVTVEGVNIHALPRSELSHFRKRFGMLFQNAALFDSMSVIENVLFPLREHRGDLADDALLKIAREKLKLVGLSGADEKMPSELSGGMKKRVGLARSLALSPKIILYDEPTTGLDPIMTRAIDNLILSVEKELNVTSVVISHDIESMFRIADQIAMLHDGVIIECSEPDKFRNSSNPVVKRFLEA